jgi:formylglycine-generating enzyme
VEAGQGTQASAPAEGAGAHPKLPQSGFRQSYRPYLPRDRDELEQQLRVSVFATWSPVPEAREQFPIAGVPWFLAMAFCAWDGGRLPSNAEWTYAASGGAEQRAYPWGNALVDNVAVWECGEHYGSKFLWSKCSATDLVPVGLRPNGRGRFGHEDMLGNVNEWLLDIDCTAPSADTCDDCVGTGSCPQRSARGGDTRMLTEEAAQTYSRALSASSTNQAMGFRCVH